MFFNKKKRIRVIIVLFLLFFFFFIGYVNYVTRGGVNSVFKSFNNETFGLFQKKINGFKKLLVLNSQQELNNLNNQYLLLQEENFLLKNNINNLLHHQKENQELRELLSVMTNAQDEYIFSQVVSYNPQNYFLSLTIDKGKNFGIKNGSPVISFNEEKRFLVGFVLSVGTETSFIQTILDQKTQVAIKIADTPAQGILQGKSYLTKSLVIDYVDISLNDLIGREVFTSGLGEKYPADIYIGKSSGVIKKNYGLFQKVEVIPEANFFTVKYVLVLKNN